MISGSGILRKVIGDVIPSTPLFEMYQVGFISMLNHAINNRYTGRISDLALFSYFPYFITSGLKRGNLLRYLMIKFIDNRESILTYNYIHNPLNSQSIKYIMKIKFKYRVIINICEHRL